MLNPSELTEVPLVRPPAGADSPALVIGGLYENHQRMIRALCRLLLRDAVEAEDAAQQTFLSAFGSLISGTVPERPAAWLATIARRECWARTAQRRDQPLLLEDSDLPLGEARDALEDAIRSADYAALWAAVKALPSQQQAAFLLRECSGLTYGEMAEALGATESAVESLLVRARRQLRDSLAPTLRAANLALTPLLLLRHRLLRLLGGNSAGGAATSAPLAAQVGSAVAAVVVVTGSVGVGVHEIRARHAQPRPLAAVQAAFTAQQAGAAVLGLPRPPEERLLAMLAAPGGALLAFDPESALLADTAAAAPVADSAAPLNGGDAAGPGPDQTPAGDAAGPAAGGHAADGQPADPHTATTPGANGPADTTPADSAPAHEPGAAPADTTPIADAPTDPPPPEPDPLSDPLLPPPDPATP
jgi:RNA polymerase sigma-70 factor (ECF subfamily)